MTPRPVPSVPCSSVTLCLETRRIALSLPHGDPLYRDWSCNNCREGAARQTMAQGPEPDIPEEVRELCKHGHPLSIFGKRYGADQKLNCLECKRIEQQRRRMNRARGNGKPGPIVFGRKCGAAK